jgi:plasmid stabilization system protein ParE
VNQRRIRLHRSFRRDFRAELGWLVAGGREDLVSGMADAVEEVAERLRQFPEIGPLEAESPTLVLRKILFRRRPYVAWYGYRRGRSITTVWLLRLFGVRQARPRPDPKDWSLD